jgi:hypothetical protein
MVVSRFVVRLIGDLAEGFDAGQGLRSVAGVLLMTAIFQWPRAENVA